MAAPIYKGGFPFFKPGIRFLNAVIFGLQTSAGGNPVNGTSGTGAGKAGPGSIYVDKSTGNLWVNTNTKASPTWSQLALGGGSGLTPATDNITANVAGTQAAATVLTSEVNRVTTAAARGASVALPAAVAGDAVYVLNATAQVITVFPVNGGTDTINQTAANTGVTMAPNETAVFVAAGASNWMGEVGVGVESTLGSIPTDLAQDTIVAAGGGQAGATALTAEVNRLTTVAAGNGVALPKSAAGMGVVVINHGANDVLVFPANGSGDAIDDAAANVSVSQMSGSLVFYYCATAGNWYSEGLATGFVTATGLATISVLDSITAAAAGTQAGATLLTKMLNRVTTAANASSPFSSVALPASAKGEQIIVINSGANPIQVFPANGSGDTINTLAANASYILGSGQIATFSSNAAGSWFTPYIPSQHQAQVGFVAANNTTGFTATGAQVSAGSVESTLNLTGTLAAGQTITLPTVANLVAAIQNFSIGLTYKLRVFNSSSANFAWTLATNTGWTFNVTSPTMGQFQARDFYITFQSSTTATIQDIGVSGTGQL